MRRGKFFASGRELGDQRALGGDLLRKRRVFRRVDDVRPRAHHRYGAPARIQRGAVRNRINAAGQPADDRAASRGQAVHQLLARLAPVGGGPARSYHRHRPLILRTERTVHGQHRRRVRDLLEEARVLVVVPGEGASVGDGQPLHLLV